MNVKVRPMETKRGNTATNQFVIFTDEGRYFQSYETIVAFISNDGAVTLNNCFEYSNTTSYYLGKFLGHGIAETRKKVNSGEYKLDKLN